MYNAGYQVYKSSDEDILLHSLFLGPSKFSYEKIIQSGKLKKIISDKDSLLDVLTCMRRTGRLVKQNQMLLCAGIYYLVHQGKQNLFSDKINDICKIPKHLFEVINIIANEDDIHNDFENLADLKTFYKIFKTNPFNNKKRKLEAGEADGDDSSPKKKKGSTVDSISSGIKNVSLGQMSKEGENKVFNFTSKHNFIEKWYLDPKKNALDLLYLLTKFKSRCGWDHKTIIQHGQFKFNGSGLPSDDANIGNAGSSLSEEGSDNRLGNINLVLNYILHGVNNIKKVDIFRDYFEQCHEPGYKLEDLPVDEITSRVIAAIYVLEKSRVVWGEPISESFEEKVAENIRKYKRAPQANAEEETCAMALGDKDINSSLGPNFGFVDKSADGPLDHFHFCPEHLPTQLFCKPKIWAALMQDMPIADFIHHICYFAHLGILDEPENKSLLLEVLKCPKRLKQIHPFQILTVVLEYKTGGSPKKRKKEKRKKWDVKDEIYEALCEAFCLSLKFNSCYDNENLDVSSDLKYKIIIQANDSMMQAGFTGDPKLSGTRAAVAIAHAIQHFCPNTSIHICRKSPYLLDNTREAKKKKNVPTLDTDLNSRVTRFKVHHNPAMDPECYVDPAEMRRRTQEELMRQAGVYQGDPSTVVWYGQPIPRLPHLLRSHKRGSYLAAPIIRAIENGEEVDAFIVFTTSIIRELGGESLYTEFCSYKAVRPGSKLIICAMDVNPEIIADTEDENVKLVCGADGFLLREIIKHMHPERCTVEDVCKFCCWKHPVLQVQ